MLEVKRGDIKAIPIEDIKALQKQLHDLDTKWVPRLAKMITEDFERKGSDETCDRQKIYNICNEIINHNRWRVLFVVHGNKLKQTLINEQEHAKSLLS